MRLTEYEIFVIKNEAIKQFGKNAKVYIFGSRVDDKRKGGDIDIYIETDVKEELVIKKIQFLVDLKKHIGEQKIDVVINNNSLDKIIFDIAKNEGVRL